MLLGLLSMLFQCSTKKFGCRTAIGRQEKFALEQLGLPELLGEILSQTPSMLP